MRNVTRSQLLLSKRTKKITDNGSLFVKELDKVYKDFCLHHSECTMVEEEFIYTNLRKWDKMLRNCGNEHVSELSSPAKKNSGGLKVVMDISRVFCHPLGGKFHPSSTQ